MENRAKSKNFKYLLLTAFILITALTLFLVRTHLENQRIDREAISFKADLTASFGSPAKISDFIEHLNGELLEDVTINTETLGEQKINFEFTNIKNKKRSREVTITIIDDIKPQIHGKNVYTVYQNYQGDLTDLMLSVDNIDDHPQREIIGDYDLAKVGTYQLTYKITDSANNCAEKNFTLQVIAPPQDQGTNSSGGSSNLAGEDFDDLIEQYKTAKTKIGIDVSQWQGEIDWKKVKQAGAEFALIRIGYQKGYDGELMLDPYFERNIKAANQLNLPVGVYFFSYAKSHADAEKQANWVLEKIKNYQVELGVTYDWENWGDYNAANMSIYTLNQVATAFLDHVKQAGYKSFNYGSKNYLDLFWNIKNHDTWLAQYYHKPTYEGDFSLWQMTDTGLIPGINGYVDIDVMYLD